MSRPRASLINFKRPKTAPSAEDFVAQDPGIPTPSLPAETRAAAPAPPNTDRRTITTSIGKRLHKALKRRAGDLEKPLQYLIEDVLESYMDKHEPNWREKIDSRTLAR